MSVIVNDLSSCDGVKDFIVNGLAGSSLDTVVDNAMFFRSAGRRRGPHQVFENLSEPQ